MKTQREIRNSFWEYIKEIDPNLAMEFRRKKRQNEYKTDIRCFFVQYVDDLHRRRVISDKLANRVTL